MVLIHELLTYLRDLTTPSDGAFLHAREGFAWEEYEDDSVNGIVLEDATAVDSAYRVLKPGGHVVLVAPEEEPTGHTGACAAEDLGFEIRDAFLVLEREGGFHYVAKPPPKEKEAGLAGLSEREESSERKNIHPTVKPVEIMERLMDDLPEGVRPVDPFLGSGTTGIAALRQNRSFLGIEKEEPYLEIADARVRHWREAEAGWRPFILRSDLEPDEKPSETVSFDDFFDL